MDNVLVFHVGIALVGSSAIVHHGIRSKVSSHLAWYLRQRPSWLLCREILKGLGCEAVKLTCRQMVMSMARIDSHMGLEHQMYDHLKRDGPHLALW
ncbi:hypothetical protein BDN72DRAFT_829857 [Pluteus cervinus]|uniref:Uncharacterized protein n=1 Tax=Pluteus cervinus TaxID=181527 RepID=A0ACD3BF13_9AGAR|nr:hypothetical protein BDN72DRAFT_829857 [Pluteus cervinus]